MTLKRITTVTALAFFVIMLVFRIAIIVSDSSDVAGVESNVIYSIIRLLESGKLYFDPARLPFSITQYTPLYYGVCALFARILGIDPRTGVHELYVLSRSLNLSFNLLTAIGVYKMCRTIFRTPAEYALLAFISAFILLFPHNFAARPDTLQDTLSVWATYFFLRFLVTRNKGLLWILSAILATAAAYTKQNGVQLIICTTIFLAASANWKVMARYFALSMILVAGTFIVYSLFSPWFGKNVIGGVENGIDLHDFYKYIIGRRLFAVQVLPFAVATVYICVKDWLVFKGTDAERFLCFVVAGTFLFAVITALKKGSTIQYFVTYSMLAIVLIVHFAAKCATDATSWLKRVPALTFCALPVIMASFLVYTYVNSVSAEVRSETARRESAITEVVAYLRNDLGLADNEYVFANLSTDYTLPPRAGINNLLAENCVVPQLDIMNFSSGRLPVFDYAKFNQYLASGTIKYLVESQPRNTFSITGEYAGLRDLHYRKVTDIDRYTIYEFSDREASLK